MVVAVARRGEGQRPYYLDSLSLFRSGDDAGAWLDECACVAFGGADMMMIVHAVNVIHTCGYINDWGYGEQLDALVQSGGRIVCTANDSHRCSHGHYSCWRTNT